VGVFADLRGALAADLAVAGVPVFPSWPDDLDVPCIFLAPPVGGDYVSAGQTFGSFNLAVDVVILVAHSTAESGIEALDTLLEAVLANSVDWSLTGVDAPAPITVTDQGADYLGVAVHLSKSTRL
jgi:hypothetical protein